MNQVLAETLGKLNELGQNEENKVKILTLTFLHTHACG